MQLFIHSMPLAYSISLLLIPPLTLAGPIRHKRADLKPVITTDFPDPSIIKVSGTWYAFASQSNFDYTNIKVQVAKSSDFDSWSLVKGKDALRKLPPWAEDSSIWAPSVSRRPDGNFLMYFSAVTKAAGNGRFHCVGTAVADSVEGPYDSNSDEPFACPTEKGGALDASYFQDGNRQYAVYKVDGNAMGNGGSCNNAIPPIASTPIMIQEVAADGKTKIGAAKEVITNSQRDGPLVEAPYMIKNKDGLYVLFFSSNCWTTDLYDVSYATSADPTGPFTKADRPLFITGTQGMIGPGGASIADDGKHFALHGYENRGKIGRIRSLYVTKVSFEGRKVII